MITDTELDADERILERVRALLAKAESSEFVEEAESFTAKAQELMSRHRIEEAMVADAASVGDPDAIEVRIEDPYARSKFSLFSRVAAANRCQAVYDTFTKVATLVGYRPDQAVTEALYTSLLVQGTAELARRGSVVDAAGVSRTRSYRNAFWAGFASRVGQRLIESNQATEEKIGGIETLPVLSRRSEAVDSRVHQMFPNVRRLRSSVTNASGYWAGDRAGQQATFAAPAQVTG